MRKGRTLTRKKALELIEKYGSQRAVARAGIGITRSMLAVAFRPPGLCSGGATKSAVQPSRPAGEVMKKIQTRADFRSRYDKDYIIPRKIRAGIRLLGRNGWLMEIDFCKLAGVTLAELGNYREQFLDYIVACERGTRRAWAGSPEMAARMREML